MGSGFAEFHDSAGEAEKGAGATPGGLLVEDRGPWETGEVQRMIGSEIATADSLARLRRGGLVHQCGDFVFASRTALEAADLWGPYSTERG